MSLIINTDVPGQILLQPDGAILLKRGDEAYPLIHLGIQPVAHEDMVIASGHFVGRAFFSSEVDVLS